MVTPLLGTALEGYDFVRDQFTFVFLPLTTLTTWYVFRRPVFEALSVYVPDVDSHYESALRGGAQIAAPPSDTDFGSREYHVRDLEGHLWTFSSYRPDIR